VKALTPLYDPVARAAHLADSLFAWWRPAAARDGRSPAPEAGEREAVHRWEDEGGNVK
jgi:hypothetical protein